MIESWRWYGPYDTISLPEIAQTGATGIVHRPARDPLRRGLAAATPSPRARPRSTAAGFDWVVVESLPIHEPIKRGEGDLTPLFANYRQSMANLAAKGIRTICYNFMPLLDWTRTDLTAPLARGGTCLRFEAARMAAFEIHMLGRPKAEDDYAQDVRNRAATWFQKASEADRDALLHAIMSGLPGAFDRYDIAGLRDALDRYDGIDRDTLRANYKRFLEEVIPTAEELGMRVLRASRRSAARHPRPAAHRVGCRGYRLDHGCGGQPGERADALLGLSGGQSGQ